MNVNVKIRTVKSAVDTTDRLLTWDSRLVSVAWRVIHSYFWELVVNDNLSWLQASVAESLSRWTKNPVVQDQFISAHKITHYSLYTWCWRTIAMPNTRPFLYFLSPFGWPVHWSINHLICEQFFVSTLSFRLGVMWKAPRAKSVSRDDKITKILECHTNAVSTHAY